MRAFTTFIMALSLASGTIAAPTSSALSPLVRDALANDECLYLCTCADSVEQSKECCGASGGRFDESIGWCVDMNNTTAQDYTQCCGGGYGCGFDVGCPAPGQW
ncbi:hypothetical protein QC764_212635 [Podospora pseudoanserina]|uniref:Uncharacterized protein n=1 Tax=Podospora pseudoanserina TaxID=2609844 RepID=A0ABR0IJN9_9PEZI|nr:hypothetical protein QC764_212635 [Podospora pseudoanserina]